MNLKKPKNFSFVFYAVLLAFIFFGAPLLSQFNPFVQPEPKIFSEVLQDLEDGKIKKVELTGQTLKFSYAEDANGKTEVLEKEVTALLIPNVVKIIEEKNIAWDYKEPWNFNFIFNSIVSVLTIGVMVFFLWLYLGRSMAEGRSNFNFGKSRHRVIDAKDIKVSFKDVAGAEEEKLYLQEIVEFLKQPERFLKLGAKVPRGVLLVGPPGTGKTLLAKAVAGEANVPFLSISGSDFVEMFVGVGASRVRDLFEEAKKLAPCIIFVDEIDAVGRQRGAGMGGGHDEREQTLNQLLVEMDGFGPKQEIIILAATNRPDILDKALLRPGRFDHSITVGYPDILGREHILKVHAQNRPLNPNIDLKEIAQITSGFTGADLANLLNEAALNAAKRHADQIEYEDISEAIFTVMVGLEKKTRVVSSKERSITAYHEAGHAIVLRTVSELRRVERVSIISAGDAGGYTAYKPYEDRYFSSKEELFSSLEVALAGRAAEQIIFGQIFTGAYGDLKSANALARDMICLYGMSDKLFNLHFSNNNEVFLGRDYGHTMNYSEEIAKKIDEEIQHLLSKAYENALRILKEKHRLLEALSQYLLKVEKIDGDVFEALYLAYTTEEERKEDAKNPAVNEISQKVLKDALLEKLIEKEPTFFENFPRAEVV